MTTRFSERRIFRSSFHIQLGTSRTRSFDEGSGSLDFHVDPNTGKLLKDLKKSPLAKEKAPEFVTTPRRQFINEGETAKFKATFEGAPQTELKWTLNDKTLTNEGRYKIYWENDIHMLEICDVKPEDNGTIVCTIKNSVGTATATAELEVFVRPKSQGKKSMFIPPTVDVPLEDTEFANKEKDASLICKFHNAIDAKASWYKDGRELGSWQANTSFDGRRAKLTLKEVVKRNCGVYECIVRNTGGEAKTRCLVSLLDPSAKLEPAKIVVPLGDQTIESGEKLVLETEVTGKPRPSLKWYRDNTELGSSQDIRMEYRDGRGRLIVDNLAATEAAKFTCIAQNAAGKDQSMAAVNVVASEDYREPPIFTKELHDMQVDDGDRVEMSVEVKGTPPIDIVWVHNNREIPPTDPVCRMVNEGNTRKLVIPEVFPEDAGEYVCEAYNGFGDTDTFCRLRVNTSEDDETPNHSHHAPDFITRPQNLQVTKGNSAILKCRVAGQPPPSVQWTKGSDKLKHGHKYKISSIGDEHTLEVCSTSVNDAGQYACTLSNAIDATTATAHVTVEESPIDFQFVLKHRTNYSPVEKVIETKTNSQKLDSSPNRDLHRSNLSINKPRKITPPPIVLKKLGNNQFDFRAVLKKTPNPAPPKASNNHQEHQELNGHHTRNSNVDSGCSSNVNKGLQLKRSSLELEKKSVQNIQQQLKRSSLELDRKGVQSILQLKIPSLELEQKSVQSVLQLKRPSLELEKKSVQKCVPNSLTLQTSVQNGVNKTHKQRVSEAIEKLTRKEPEVSTKKTPPPVFNRYKNRRTGSSVLENNKVGLPTDFRSVLKHRHKPIGFENQSVKPKMTTEINLKPIPEVTKKPVTAANLNPVNEVKLKPVGEVNLKPVTEINIKPVTEVSLQPFNEAINKPEKGVQPEVGTGLEDQSVRSGSKAVLECQIRGTPTPDISWSVNNKHIQKSQYFQTSYDNNMASLVLSEALSEDEGEYKCTATSPLGSVATSCHLNVQANTPQPEPTEEEPFSPTISPPKIYDISPAHFCILRGATMEFRASFSAVPMATITWFKNKQKIKTDRRIKIDTSEHFSTLTIINIQSGDSGRFAVTIENEIGSDTAYASLTVEDIPQPPVGEPAVSFVTLTSAVLSWSGPAYDGGSPITNYRVEVCNAEDQTWTTVDARCVSTTCHIPHLKHHTPYFFRVFAENKHGVSEPCTTSDVTVTSAKRPSMLARTMSMESDDVFAPDTVDVCSPVSDLDSPCDFVSPLSPDEAPFEHREITATPGELFEDHYECMEEVGKGKFGSVYKCKEKSTGNIWAAKIVKCREADKSKIRLEIEIMNKLKHPKILMLWDTFVAPRKMILVMEYIGGGELFERVIDDNFVLTERDCIQFMRQICDGVAYMHTNGVLHLDLKPENVLCIKPGSNKIKIIDFGLARLYKSGESVRVLFGTPEFIAPEVVNYDEIGFATDVWSMGVICYVLLTGLSPFLGDSDAETLSNVTMGEFDFEEEDFDNISEDAKDFIDRLLIKNKRKRMTIQQCLEHKWLAEDTLRRRTLRINTKNLKRFMARRKWQKTGLAIRALGRFTAAAKLFKPALPALSSVTPCYDSGTGSASASSTSSVESRGTLTSASGVTMTSVAGEKHVSVSDSFKGDEMEENEPIRTENIDVKMTSCAVVKLKPLTQNTGQTTTEDHRSAGDRTSYKHNTDINCNKTESNYVNSLSGITLNSQNQNSRSKDQMDGRTKSDEGPANPCASCDKDSRARSGNQKSCRPKFNKQMIDSKAFVGDIVRFDVEYAGHPCPEVTWHFEDELIDDAPRHTIQQEDGTCSLIIKDVTEDDDGEYTCNIANNVGHDTCSAELIVFAAI